MINVIQVCLNCISRLILRSYLIGFVISISISMYFYYNVKKHVCLTYLIYLCINKHTMFKRSFYWTKSDLISKPNNLIEYNFSKGSRLRLLGVRDSCRCKFTLSQPIFFAQKGPRLRALKCHRLDSYLFFVMMLCLFT